MTSIYALIASWAYRICRLLFVILPRKFKMPKLFFGNPERVVDKETDWWHLSIGIEKKYFWQLDFLPNCRIFAVFPELKAEVQLVWQGAIEPVVEQNLQYGEVYKKIPLIIRTTLGDIYMTGAPGRLKYISLPGFTARMTDINSLYFTREPYVDVPPGVHAIQFRVESGADTILSKVFLLVVPNTSKDNQTFELRTLP